MEATNNIKLNSRISIVDIVKIATTVVAVVGATTFFIYKMQSLPPRVDKLEQDLSSTRKELTYQINTLQSQIDKSATKTDIILEDVKLIKNYILNNHIK